MKTRKIPLRMCVACREMKEKKCLIRIVKNENGVFADLTGKISGRGAYVCFNKQCVEKLKRQKQIDKTFEMTVNADLYDKLTEIINESNP